MNTELLKQVKENNQDVEWYPTTDEILNVLVRHANIFDSVLDIGAGNGKALGRFKGDRYAIEKSTILLDSLPSDVVIVGVDFHQNTLIDKSVDLIFCNPPYSEYEQWVVRIIKEANANEIYLVMPVRWQNNDNIANAIKDRHTTGKVLGVFNFENSEDRKARATVNLVKIDLGRRDRHDYLTPFELFFKERFGDITTNDKVNSWDVDDERRKVIKNELIKSGDLITTLIECYVGDLKKLEQNYTAITSLDADVLIDFKINLDSLIRGLESKMRGLKSLYWRELFSRFGKVTNRLTSYAQDAFLSQIFRNTSVDFTRQNIFAITDWVIRNANTSFNDQILEFYERMIERANCRAYKSNERVFEQERWGWNGRRARDDNDKYSNTAMGLLNQIIISHGTNEGYSGENSVTLRDSAIDYFNDLRVIAEQLGYPISTELMAGDSKVGYSFLRLNRNHNLFIKEAIRGVKYRTWYERDGKVYVLYQAKMFKNGNIHIKFNQEFMNKLNIIYGKNKGWLSNPQQASEEMGIKVKEAKKHFGYSAPVIGADYLMLEQQEG